MQRGSVHGEGLLCDVVQPAPPRCRSLVRLWKSGKVLAGLTVRRMINDYSYTEARWNVCVSVRPSGFIPLYGPLRDYNVEVDPTQPGPYGSRREALPACELLHVDLQTNCFLDRPGRLGAGRAGCYRGRYLKGVGRTPLAANWNIISDQKAATGHLPVSSAVREFIVSCYLKAKGKASVVNGCEGFLVGPLSPALRDYCGYGYDALSAISPCNLDMQAISVKSSRFARFSNFAWLLSNLDLYSSAQDLREFFKGFVAYLDSPSHIETRPATPARIAEAFSRAIERTLENFREFWRLGIYWGAPFNNLTMDGRYHDLDTVMFLGGPFLGVLPEKPIGSLCAGAYDPSRIFGLEVLTYIQYVRMFFRFFISRLDSIPAMELPLSSNEREFIRATVKELRRQIGKDHILFSRSRLCDHLAEWMREDAGLSGRHLGQAKALIRDGARLRLSPRSRPSNLQVSLRPLPLRCARPGTYRQYEPPHIVSYCSISQTALEEAQFLHDLLRKIDAVADRESLLTEVSEAARSVAKYCAAPPATIEKIS